MIYHLTPLPKPRMTKSDKWKKRDCVLRYWKFKDEVQEQGIMLDLPCKVTFYMPMPKSWPKKKKAAHIGKPHLQTPDIDNLLKALLDALYDNDSHIWTIWAEKRWSHKGYIEIEKVV